MQGGHRPWAVCLARASRLIPLFSVPHVPVPADCSPFHGTRLLQSLSWYTNSLTMTTLQVFCLPQNMFCVVTQYLEAGSSFQKMRRIHRVYGPVSVHGQVYLSVFIHDSLNDGIDSDQIFKMGKSVLAEVKACRCSQWQQTMVRSPDRGVSGEV